MEKHPLHLKNPEFQTSEEVQRAVERQQDRTGEKVPNDPSERIEAYMDRLENVFLNPDPKKRERNLEMFRDKIHNQLIIKREFPRGANTDQIYRRAEELGLELCPADTGPNYRLKYQNQPLNEWVYVGMKQIADRDGFPSVFRLVRDGGVLWLRSHWTKPGNEGIPGSEFVFRFRKSEA